MKRKKGRKYSRGHTIRRARERYGIEMSIEDYEALCAVARKNKKSAFTIEKNGTDRQFILPVTFKKTTMIAVYSESEDRVKTVLPWPQGQKEGEMTC